MLGSKKLVSALSAANHFQDMVISDNGRNYHQWMNKQWSFLSPAHKLNAIGFYDRIPNQITYMTVCFAVYTVPLFNLMPSVAQVISDLVAENLERSNSSGIEFAGPYAVHVRACLESTLESANWNHPVMQQAKIITSRGVNDPVFTATARLFSAMKIENEPWSENLLRNPFFFMETMNPLTFSPLAMYWADLSKIVDVTV